MRPLAGSSAGRRQQMYFDERNMGDYRIYAGALEAPRGDGYIATLVVQRVKGVPAPREILRDESIACGHRWESANDALAYAINKATAALRKQEPMLLS